MDGPSTSVEFERECRALLLAQRIGQVGSWTLDATLSRLDVSPVLLELYGLPPDTVIETTGPLDELVHPEDRNLMNDALTRLLERDEPIDFRFRVRHASDGALRWFRVCGRRDGEHIAGTVADVTDAVAAEIDARQAHADLLRAGAQQQAVIAASPDAIHLYDVAAGTFTRASTSGKPFTGFTAESVDVICGDNLSLLVPNDDLVLLADLLDAAVRLPDGDVVHLRHRVRHADGTVRWLSRRMTPLARNDDGDVSTVLVISRDVSEGVAGQHRLEQAAAHDDLTGLANRRCFRDRLTSAMAEDGRTVGVLICDLDGFKRINDTQGHLAGDQVLVQAANRLLRASRAGDTVARLGGDEFAVLIDVTPDHDPYEQARAVATRIIDAIAQPFAIGGYEHSITVSVGIRIATGEDVEKVLNDADAAMYFIKRHGAAGMTFYDPAHRPGAADADRLERLIVHALAEDLVEVHYQPVVDPRTNAIRGVEALLRIHDEHSGRYADTAKIIEVAEATGLVIALDDRVLHLACRQLATWQQIPALAHLGLKVNRSAKEVARPGFRQRVSDALRDAGLEPASLTLELTETVLLEATTETLDDLRSLNAGGVGLAIDDFGTGYASLRYLAELPITCIKIDRSFVAGLPDDPIAMTLVRATIGLAEQLGIGCIVEGVETMTQLEALSPNRHLFVQGYLYSRPQPADMTPPATLEPVDPADVTFAA